MQTSKKAAPKKSAKAAPKKISVIKETDPTEGLTEEQKVASVLTHKAQTP